MDAIFPAIELSVWKQRLIRTLAAKPGDQRSRYITSSVAPCQFEYNICCTIRIRHVIFRRHARRLRNSQWPAKRRSVGPCKVAEGLEHSDLPRREYRQSATRTD